MAKKALEEMTKLELLEYAKRARYMLGKMHLDRETQEARIRELETELEVLRSKQQRGGQIGG